MGGSAAEPLIDDAQSPGLQTFSELLSVYGTLGEKGLGKRRSGA